MELGGEGEAREPTERGWVGGNSVREVQFLGGPKKEGKLPRNKKQTHT